VSGPGPLGDRAAARVVRWSGWALTRASAGRRAFALPSSGPGAAVHLTTVIRLPADVAAALAPALDRLRALGPGHHYYPPATMHVTVRNLDGLTPADGTVAAVGDLVAAQAPFRLAVRGLGVAPGTVYALALPGDAGLRSLRSALGRLPAAGRPRRWRPGRGLGHANLVRFSGPVSAAFLAELARLGRGDFGSFAVEEVELVRTDRLLSPEGTTTLARVRLTGRPG
jgi:2'-5' RNA ligase